MIFTVTVTSVVQFVILKVCTFFYFFQTNIFLKKMEYTGWPFYLKTLKYLENYASDKKKWVMKVVRLEGGHPMIPNSTPHRHPLGVGVGGR